MSWGPLLLFFVWIPAHILIVIFTLLTTFISRTLYFRLLPQFYFCFVWFFFTFSLFSVVNRFHVILLYFPTPIFLMLWYLLCFQFLFLFPPFAALMLLIVSSFSVSLDNGIARKSRSRLTSLFMRPNSKTIVYYATRAESKQKFNESKFSNLVAYHIPMKNGRKTNKNN